MHKGSGYVRDVFRTRNMRELTGNLGIGHCRYPTAGSAASELESQPFYVNSPFGITLAHNGNLTNSEALKRELFQLDFRHVNTNSDSEVLLNVLALELERAAHHARLDAERDLHRGRRRAPALPRRLRDRRDDRRLRAGRLPRSVRHPAAHHRRQRGDGRHANTWSRANRSRSRRSASRCCATSRPARRSSSTRPATFHARQCAEKPILAPCIFEYVYLARPDSVIDGTSVYESRLHMGEQLAHKIRAHAGGAATSTS